MSKDKRVPFGIYAPDGNKLKSYNTEQDAKSDINLTSNQVVQIIGKITVDDGLGYTAIIENTNKNGILLDNGLFANPIPNTNGSEKVDKTKYESDKQGLENSIKSVDDKADGNMGAVQDGAFPLTQAEVGKTYRAGNGKLYECITAYDGEQISLPNENFKELSIIKNSEVLDTKTIKFLDYEKAEQLELDLALKTYKVTKQGMFSYCIGGFNGGRGKVVVNGLTLVDISTGNSGVVVVDAGMIPVDIGDIVEYNTGYNVPTWLYHKAMFIPFKK